MAIDDNILGDDLELELKVTGEERWEGSLRRAERFAEDTAEAIDDSFESGLKFADKFAQATLNLEKRTESLARQFASLSTKNFGKDLDSVGLNARDAVTRLAQLQQQLALLGRQFATTEVSKGKFDRLTSPIRDEINFLERQLLLTKQLQTLQAQSIDPRRTGPVDFAATDSRRMLALASSLDRLDQQFTRLSQRNLGEGFEQLQQKVGVNISRIAQLREQVGRLDRALIGETRRTVIEEITQDARVAENEVQKLKREILEMNAAIRRTPGSPGGGRPPGGGGGIGSIFQGLGIPYLGAGLGIAGAVAVGVTAFHKFAEGLRIVEERGTKVIQANRRLMASASELGTTYADLSDKNERYAKLLGLSSAQTADFTSKVAQLVARTADSESQITKLTQGTSRIDQFAKGLADLAAARGFNAEELITVTNQIITGQDEAYKKLGVRNPQVLYAEFAQRTGQSVESLSQIQKQIIYQDEILKKSLLFSGAAQARIESIDGQIAKTRSTFENLADAISLATLNSRAFFDLLQTANSVLAAFGNQVDEVKKKIAGGESTAALAQQGAEGGIYSNLSKLGSILTFDIGQSLGQGLSGGSSTGPVASLYNKFSGASDDLFEQELLRRYNAFKLELAQQKQVADDVKQQLADQRREEEIRQGAAIAELTLENTIKRQRFSVEAIKQAYEELEKQIANDTARIYFNQAKIDEIEFKKAEAISNAAGERFRQLLANPKSGIAEYQRGLSEIRDDSNLTQNDRERLIIDFERQIENSVKKVESLKNETRGLLTEIYGRENPFVKLFSDMETAVDRAQKRFGEFGSDFVQMIAQMEQAQLKIQIAQERWFSEMRSLDFRQQAEALEALSYQQTDGFQRRLQFLADSGEFINRNRELSNRAEEASFLANTFDPRGRFNNPNRFGSDGFLESKYGFAGLDRLSRGFEDSGVSFQQFVDTQIRINELKEDLAKFQGLDTSGLGILGREAIARAVDERIPSNEELAGRLNSYGDTREDARRLLQLRAQNAQTVAEANRERFQELVRNQQVAERTRRFAQEKIDLLQKQQGLEQAFTAQQVLDVTSQLGPGELTSSLRSARLQALQIKAEDEKQKELKAIEQAAKIEKVMDKIDNALSDKGLKIDTSTSPLLNVQIDNNASNATTQYRPTASDTTNRR